MQRSFLLNLALLLVLNLLVKPFYILGIDAGVQDAVGSAAYGTYAALLSLGFLLNIILDLGMTNHNTRHMAQHTHLMGKTLSGALGVRFLLVLLYALITAITGFVLGFRGAQMAVLGWIIFNQALVATILYLRSNIAGAQRYKQDSLLSVLDRVLLIGMVGWLLWGRSSDVPFRIEWFVWAQTIAYGVTALVALVMVLRIAEGVRLAWQPAFAWVVVKQSFPYALLILLMTFYYRIDTLMLERMLPDGDLQAGIYAQGFRFFEAFNMLGYLMAGLLLPMFSRLLAEAKKSGTAAAVDIQPLVLLAMRLVLTGALAVAVFGIANAQGIMDLRYSENTTLSAPVFALLIGCFVAVCTTYVFGTLLTAGGNLKYLNWMAACGALLNIALNLVLIPRMQAEGAAWASLITQLVTALAQIGLAASLYAVRVPNSLWIRSAIYAAGLGGTAFLAYRSGLGLLPQLLVFAGGALILSVATGMLGRKVLQEAVLLRPGTRA
ncbi:MAG TPA: polysaccharide biosynthesis C-terminal domain-containing protein [Flavobacteriales bacterium]|nr:polysaccharide biosynthesis C-terminal domain-containing protein [Flavobacteriales bacterium]